ncbi:MAG: hydrogenase maturation nickel metallochaperone HypA [Gammaproteobacteria bacterium]|nr:hydrogenase maturation nickel metallochaperone HypA [Gammaproteobacteria bacterium]
MHELSICHSLIKQVEAIALEQSSKSVQLIQLQIGPLSGIDASLLKHSFPIASTGTIAEGAELLIEQLPVNIRCLNCGRESSVEINRLVCHHCQHTDTQLLSGDEMLLHSVKLET